MSEGNPTTLAAGRGDGEDGIKQISLVAGR